MRCLHSCWGAASRWAYRLKTRRLAFFSFVVGKQRPLNEVPAPAEPDHEEDGPGAASWNSGHRCELYPDDDDAELSRASKRLGMRRPIFTSTRLPL